MSPGGQPRISVESSDPGFCTFARDALEAFGPFVVLCPAPRGPEAPPPADLILLDRRYRPFARTGTSPAPSAGSPRPELPIVIVTDHPDVPEIVQEFGTGRPVHVLSHRGDARELGEEVTRIWERHCPFPGRTLARPSASGPGVNVSRLPG